MRACRSNLEALWFRCSPQTKVDGPAGAAAVRACGSEVLVLFILFAQGFSTPTIRQGELFHPPRTAKAAFVGDPGVALGYRLSSLRDSVCENAGPFGAGALAHPRGFELHSHSRR